MKPGDRVRVTTHVPMRDFAGELTGFVVAQVGVTGEIYESRDGLFVVRLDPEFGGASMWLAPSDLEPETIFLSKPDAAIGNIRAVKVET